MDCLECNAEMLCMTKGTLKMMDMDGRYRKYRCPLCNTMIKVYSNERTIV